MTDEELIEAVATMIEQFVIEYDTSEELARAVIPLAQAPLLARIAELEAVLVKEREERLWAAYDTGNRVNGFWTHMFMAEGEWLVSECGLDPTQPDFDDNIIRQAIPNAARNALRSTQ